MRNIYFAGAAALAMAAPGYAQAQDANSYDGFGSLSVGYHSMNYDDTIYVGESSLFGHTESTDTRDTDTGLDLEFRASAAVPLNSRIAAQVDGVYSRTAYDNNSGETDVPILKRNQDTIALHAFWRKPSERLLGVIGQHTGFTGNGRGGASVYYIGGEHQEYIDRMTIYSQVAYVSADSVTEDINGVNASVQFRYFPKDNTMYALKVSYERLTNKPEWQASDCTDDCVDQNYKTWMIGGKMERRLANSRLSFLVDADYRILDSRLHRIYIADTFSTEQSIKGKSGDLRFTIGLKLNFGSGTLFSRDRSGASLDPIRPLGTENYVQSYNIAT